MARINRRGHPRPPWTAEEHALLVAMAPTECGAQAIVDALAAAYPEGGRDLNAVRHYASKIKVPITRSRESYTGRGPGIDAAGHIITPPRPYANPDEVFASVDFGTHDVRVRAGGGVYAPIRADARGVGQWWA